MHPPVSYTARSAFLPEAGLPMRIAVATVSGSSTGTKLSLPRLKAMTSGAEPPACTPVSIGSSSIQPRDCHSLSALYAAQMFAALPTG